MNMEECLTILNNGTYSRKKYTIYAMISIVTGIFFTLVFYPGVLYSDSYGRWTNAVAIYQAALRFDFSHIKSWVSITPQFFMALLYSFTFNYASFTLIQSILFFFSIFLMIDKFVSYYKVLVSISLIFCPVFYGYSIYHEMSVGCVIGINFGLILLFSNNLKNYPCWKISRKIMYCIGLFISFYVAFGFRQNAFTVFPVIIAIAIYGFIYENKNKILTTLQVATICLSLILVGLIPSSLNIIVYNSSSSGFVWEILSVIQEMPEEKKIEYNDYLDFIAGDGTTLKALEVNNKSASVNAWQWDVFGTSRIGDKNVQAEIFQKYTNLIIHETKYYLKVKLYFISRLLGINEPLRNAEYDYNRWDQLQNYGMVDNELRFSFVQSYHNFQNAIVTFRTPWIWFSVGFFCVIGQFLLADKKHSFSILTLFLIAMFYYGAFLINTQSFEFRYYFPSFFLLLLVAADTFTKICHKAICFISEKIIPCKVKDYCHIYKRVLNLFIVITCLLLVFLWPLYRVWAPNSHEISDAQKHGVLMYRDIQRWIYLYDNALYFKTEKKTDFSLRFFLHLHPKNLDDLPKERIESKFDNYDFNFADKIIKLPSWKQSYIAKISLPDYAIDRIITGQYDGSGRLWETTIKTSDHYPVPQSILPANLSDNNWKNGISNSRLIVLLPNEPINYDEVVGRYVVDNLSERILIEEVRYRGKWIHLILTKPIDSSAGYPNLLSVEE